MKTAILAAALVGCAPEQQGHGHTADLDRPLSFEQMADDSAQLLRTLGVMHVDVMGFSRSRQFPMHCRRWSRRRPR